MSNVQELAIDGEVIVQLVPHGQVSVPGSLGVA
jgi:hypothetical protein